MALTVVTWKWRQRGYIEYSSARVNECRRAVALHYPRPHRFVCVTDDPAGLDPGIEIVPLWDTHRELKNPSNALGPNCFPRLFAWSAEAAALFGPRFVSIDLDCLIGAGADVGDAALVPLWDRDEDLVIWGNPAAVAPYNPSMFLLKSGARREVWDRFDPKRSPLRAQGLGYYGSDMGWIGACLGKGEATWSEADGVYSFRRHVRGKSKVPADARVIFFAGKDKPWDPRVRRRYRFLEELVRE